MGDTLLTFEEKQELRKKRYADCLELVPLLISMYVDMGLRKAELDSNIRMAKAHGMGRVDTSRLESFAEEVGKWTGSKAERGGETGESFIYIRTNFFRAYSLHCLWCAMQHIAVGALRPAVDSAGKAVGYYAAYKKYRSKSLDSDEIDIQGLESEAMSDAYMAESEFLSPYQKRGVVE